MNSSRSAADNGFPPASPGESWQASVAARSRGVEVMASDTRGKNSRFAALRSGSRGLFDVVEVRLRRVFRGLPIGEFPDRRPPVGGLDREDGHRGECVSPLHPAFAGTGLEEQEDFGV